MKWDKGFCVGNTAAYTESDMLWTAINQTIIINHEPPNRLAINFAIIAGSSQTFPSTFQRWQFRRRQKDVKNFAGALRKSLHHLSPDPHPPTSKIKKKEGRKK